MPEGGCVSGVRGCVSAYVCQYIPVCVCPGMCVVEGCVECVRMPMHGICMYVCMPTCVVVGLCVNMYVCACLYV